MIYADMRINVMRYLYNAVIKYFLEEIIVLYGNSRDSTDFKTNARHVIIEISMIRMSHISTFNIYISS